MKYTIDIKSTLLGMLLTVALVFCIAAVTSTDSATWDYKVVRSHEPTKLEPQLAELGKEGWSVVASSEFHFSQETPALTIILKRPSK